MSDDNSAQKINTSHLVTFSNTTKFNGVLRFKEGLCIQGKFDGTIDAPRGTLTVDSGAKVEADAIRVTNLAVHGSVKAPVHASGKIDLHTGAEVHGDLVAGRLRIADGVIFDGKCSMLDVEKDVEIFSRPTTEIKAELRASTAHNSAKKDDAKGTASE